MKPNKPYVLGLTGGIACGKSYVARLLRQRGCSVAEAADQVGVHDHNYFTKIFKAYMGETPRDYQKRAQKDRAAKR